MLLRKFSWLYRCANWRYRDFFAAENIKDIKSFRAKKIGFNISGNYSGGFLIANCAGKKCTARCSQRVAQRFSDVCTLWSSYQWANISAEPHVASNVRYIAFSMRTNTLLTPSKVRYISHLGHTPNTAEPHAFKQGAVHCLAMTTWILTPNW